MAIVSKSVDITEVKLMPRKRSSDGDGWRPAREIVDGRLSSVSFDDFTSDHANGATILVSMGDDRGMADLPVPLVITWSADDNVDERVLEGIIRFCSSAMKGVDQKVLLVGTQDAIDTVAACILREYMGVSAGVAFSIMRNGHPDCLQKHELTDTVLNFKPS